jgi:hypothetical protein
LFLLLLTALTLAPAAGLSIAPDKQIIVPGKSYSFTVDSGKIVKAVIVNNITKATVNWGVEIEGGTVAITVPENAEFAEYILKVEAYGGNAEAQLVIKPPLDIMLATFALPIFLSVGMLGGGMYVFFRKRGTLRFVGVGIAVFGALILFGVLMAVIAIQMV